MTNTRVEEKEALQALVDYSPKLIRGMQGVSDELAGDWKPDTEEYLLSVIKGMNWELQVLNGTLDYLNEEEQLLDKEKYNEALKRFNESYQNKDYEALSENLRSEVITLFVELEEIAKQKMA